MPYIEDNNIAPDKIMSGAFIMHKNIHIVSMPIPHSFNQIFKSCNFIIRYKVNGHNVPEDELFLTMEEVEEHFKEDDKDVHQQ